MYMNDGYYGFSGLLGRRERAIARVSGSSDYPEIKGSVRFYDTPVGVLVVTDISGLPMGEKCRDRIFGFHIHSGHSCTRNESDPFANALTHYNPDGCEHPYHAGDMPSLFGADGNAFCAFLSNRFTIDEIIGKTVVIHDAPDDFTTQPSGNSGNKIACGEIMGQKNTFS